MPPSSPAPRGTSDTPNSLNAHSQPHNTGPGDANAATGDVPNPGAWESPSSLRSLQRVDLSTAARESTELTVSHVADTLVDSAQTVVERRFRILLLIRDAYARLANDSPALQSVLSDLSAMLRLLYAWANASYQRVPWPALMMVAGAVGYFVLPLDLIPDVLGPIGLMDDAAIIASTVQTVRGELERFRQWEDSGSAMGERSDPNEYAS